MLYSLNFCLQVTNSQPLRSKTSVSEFFLGKFSQYIRHQMSHLGRTRELVYNKSGNIYTTYRHSYCSYRDLRSRTPTFRCRIGIYPHRF